MSIAPTTNVNMIFFKGWFSDDWKKADFYVFTLRVSNLLDLLSCLVRYLSRKHWKYKENLIL